MQSGRLTRRCTIRERKENSEHFFSCVEGDGSVSWGAETVETNHRTNITMCMINKANRTMHYSTRLMRKVYTRTIPTLKWNKAHSACADEKSIYTYNSHSEMEQGPQRLCRICSYIPCITHMPGNSYRRRLRSLLLYLCDVFQLPINSSVFV